LLNRDEVTSEETALNSEDEDVFLKAFKVYSIIYFHICIKEWAEVVYKML